LSVVEYKVAKATEHLSEVQEQAKDAEIDIFASKLAGKEIIRMHWFSICLSINGKATI